MASGSKDRTNKSKKTFKFGLNGVIPAIVVEDKGLERELKLDGLKYIDDVKEENNNKEELMETDVDRE